MTVQDDSPDHGARIHRAAHDPEFPAKRDAALSLLRAAVGASVAAQGFVEKPQSWVREGPRGRVAVIVFPSRFGFEAEIRLTFLPSGEEPEGIWAEVDHLTLAAFEGPEAVIYLDILDDPGCLAAVVEMLELRALPWLIGQLVQP